MDALRKADASGELANLRKALLNLDGNTDLANRFRALFHLRSLGTEGSKEAMDIIHEGFNDPSELLKHEMAYVLGQTRQEYALSLLENVLKDQSQQAMVRHEAAEALGALGFPGALEILNHYWKNDPLVVVRQTCELAVARILWEQSESARTEKMGVSPYESIDPAPPLPINEKATVESLQELLNDQSKPLFERYRAMFRLRDIGSRDADLALVTGFKDPSALFRHEIAYVCGQVCDPATVPALVEVLENPNEEGMVRHEAAEALGSIATEDVLPILRKLADDKETVVRQSAEVALDMYEYETSDQVDYTTMTA